jgi:pilus assembly protein CpaE
MKPKTDILVLTKDVDTESTLRLLLDGVDQVGGLLVSREIDSLASTLEKGLVPLVLVDVDPDPYGMLRRLEPIVNRYLHTRFVVLARELKNDLVMQAMQVGVRYVQMKERIPAELPGVIQRILATAPVESRRTGSAITVLSAGGGAGCTTLAVNLANELQLTTSEPVLIVDLDYAYGAVAAYLELEGKYGVADVLAYEGTIDPDLIETTAVRLSDTIRALLSPASINFGRHGAIEPHRLAEMLAACRQRHRFTIFDAARLPMDAAAVLANASETTLVVLQPVVKDIRITNNIIKSLVSRGVAVERIKPILNRYRKRRELITVEEAQKALGGIIPECLSNDYDSAIQGNNYGKLLSASAPRSALRKDFVHLASQFSRLEGHRNGAEKQGTGVGHIPA